MIPPMEFICGGYFLTKRGPRGAEAVTRPGKFVTISSRTGFYFFPDSWALSWVNESETTRVAIAAALDIPPSALPSLIPQVTDVFEKLFFWPNAIPSVDAARQLLQLVPRSPDWLLVGFAVAAEQVERLLARNAPPPQKPGFAPTGAGGVFKTLAERKPLEPGFVELGFDVLNIDHGMVLQTNLDFDLALTKAYDGILNAEGLLPEYAAARHAAEVLTNRRDLGSPRTMTAAKIVSYDAYRTTG
jgi:hypothetical protein